jgi:DNA-binding transcriptional LysR family regulator
MELRQLEYFVAVAEEANFTRAARRVHISQSGVSAQIRQLERDLGAPLFDRSERTATLTTAGAAALGPARAALASADAIRAAVDDVNGLVRGRLVVGMVTGCTITPLFDALSGFHRDHPGIEIELVEDASDALVDLVRSGALDLALVGTPEPTPGGLESLTIIRDRLVAAVPRDHALSTRRRIALADLCDLPLVCLPEGTGVRAVFDQACAAADLHPVISLQASAPAAVADLAVRGLGVAVLSETMVDDHRDALHPLTISGAAAPALLALVWRPGEGPALRQLLDRCRAAFT